MDTNIDDMFLKFAVETLLATRNLKWSESCDSKWLISRREIYCRLRLIKY